jgi:lysine-N-methylase
MRFACPSAAANKGRPAQAHDRELADFAAMLAEREGLGRQPDGALVRPPRLQSGQRLAWPDLLRIVQFLLSILGNRRDRVERRLRKCVALADLCRQARFDKLKGARLNEFLNLVSSGLDGEVAADAASLPPPSSLGRMLFRQAAAIYTRKDYGPNRGLAKKGRVALIGAAWRFARGTGSVPAMHAWIPATTFEALEAPTGPLPAEAEELLERYYVLKVGALQFCGPAYFGVPFWEGLEALAITLPTLLWVSRAFTSLPRGEAITRALSIVDDHFGFNRVLGTARQRLSFRILARRGELTRLIAWYSR